MRKTVAWACAIALMAISAPVAAQDSVPAQAGPDTHIHGVADAAAPLTLDAAIAEAVANNTTLAHLQAELPPLRFRRDSEQALAPPTADVEIWQWPVTSINPLDTNMYMLMLRQEIPGRGKRAARAAVVDRELDIAANAVGTRKREVIGQVKRAYAELSIARQALAVHQQHVDLLRQTADLAVARYATGHGEQQESLKAVADIARLHGDIVMLNQRAAIVGGQLNALLNRPPGAPIGDVLEARAVALPPLADLEALALAQHPELKGAALELEHAKALVAVANSELKPDFMVMGGYQLMPRSAGAWTAGIGVTWPNAPWSRGGLEARRAEATANVELAAAKQRETVTMIRLAVQQAYVRASSAAERARLLQTAVVPQSERVLDASRIAYAADRGTATTVIENERMVLDAQLAYLEALSDAAQARADLETAVGADVPAGDAAPVEVTR